MNLENEISHKKPIQKMGFWSVLALVMGSQIGSGVLMMPAIIAPFGKYSLFGWGISAFGAIFLALVFAKLCMRFPKTGGPHAYIREAFGDIGGFFGAWTYWLCSVISTTAIITTSVTYLTPLIGVSSPLFNLLCQFFVLFLFTGLNLRGVQFAGIIEVVLSNIKVIPLIFLPLAGLFYFNIDNFEVTAPILGQEIPRMLSQTVLLTMWAFLGIETATTPAESVENPSKTIPKAVVLGTILVAALYLFNSIGIQGIMKGSTLAKSQAPYADAASFMFKGNWHYIISLLSSIMCFGTLNAWILSGGQVPLGAAQDGFFSKIFLKKNKNDAPVVGILANSLIMSIMLLLTTKDNLSQQINLIMDLSTLAFIFVYAGCALSFGRVLLRERNLQKSIGAMDWLSCIVALLFCFWIIFSTDTSTLLYSSLFSLSGIPFFLIFLKTSRKKVD